MASVPQKEEWEVLTGKVFTRTMYGSIAFLVFVFAMNELVGAGF